MSELWFPYEGDWQYDTEKDAGDTLNDDPTDEKILSLYKEYKGGTLFNSEVACIKALNVNDSSKKIIFGKTSFYKFLLSNVINNQIDTFGQFLLNNGYTLEEIEHYFRPTHGDKYPSFVDLINSGDFANALAISVLIRDVNDDYLVVQRGSKTIVSSNMTSVSVTGSMDYSDLSSDSPFLFCAKREIQEELGMIIPFEQMKLLGIVAGKSKCQPIVLIDVNINSTFADYSNEFHNAIDFYQENDDYHIVQKDTLLKIVNEGKTTEAGRFHMKLNVGN